MAHKHTQYQIDEVINKWRGKLAEKLIGEYDGPKWSKHQRYRLAGGTIFNISTDTAVASKCRTFEFGPF